MYSAIPHLYRDITDRIRILYWVLKETCRCAVAPLNNRNKYKDHTQVSIKKMESNSHRKERPSAVHLGFSSRCWRVAILKIENIMICSVVTQKTFRLLLKSCLYYSLCNLEWLTSAVKCSLKGFCLCKQILASDLMKCSYIPKCLLLWLLRMSVWRSYPCLNKLTYFVKEKLLLAYVWVCAWGAESPLSSVSEPGTWKGFCSNRLQEYSLH